KVEPTTVSISGLGDIKIIPLTQKIRNEARLLATDVNGELDLSKFQSYIILNCLVEPKLEISDISWVENLPTGIIDEILTQIYKISGLEIDFETLKKK
ncbi:MAG: hypothetical protein QXN68_00860, partial [Thermoplasmata archaeon]